MKQLNKRGQLAAVQGAVISLIVIVALITFMFLFSGKIVAQSLTDAGGNNNATSYKAVNDTQNAATNIVTYLPYIIIALMIGLAIFALTRFLGGSVSSFG